MRIVIAGTGAMACLFGARLAPFAEVTLLGTWAEGIGAINERGIVVARTSPPTPQPPSPSPVLSAQERGKGATGVGGEVRATADPASIPPADLALVFVKSWQTERAARQLAGCLAPHGVAITLQNGHGNLETLEACLGKERSALGVTTQGATLLGPGHVREGGAGPVHIGEHPRVAPALALLASAGFETHRAENVNGLLWGKLVVNAGINALTALLRVPNGALLERPDARALMDAAASEAAGVARAQGIDLPFADPVEQTRSVARRTASNFSSMYQDVLRGAPTEIDAINGAVCREGEWLGVPTRVNWTLWRLVRAIRVEARE